MLLNSKLFILPPDEIKSIGRNNLTYGSLNTKGLKNTANTITNDVCALMKHFGTFTTGQTEKYIS